MNPIFAFHALRELSKNKQRQVIRLGPLCTGAIFVVWSFPVFRYLT